MSAESVTTTPVAGAAAGPESMHAVQRTRASEERMGMGMGSPVGMIAGSLPKVVFRGAGGPAWNDALQMGLFSEETTLQSPRHPGLRIPPPLSD